GILWLVVDPHLIMHVRARTAAGASEKPDLFMFGDPLSDRHDIAVKMAVNGRDAVSVIDFDDLAVIAEVAGIGYGSCSGRMNRRHVRCRQVDPGMKGRTVIEWIAARAKSAFELIVIERHRQRQ